MSRIYIPRQGDIVAWNNETKCVSIAVMMNEDEFSVCLNYRGRKDEESRVWEWDNVPTNKALRHADKLEMAWLFAELVAQGYQFKAEDGKVVVNIEPEREQKEEQLADEPKVRVECVFLNRNQRFAKYIYELAQLYQQKGSFVRMSELSRNNNISSVKKDVCFKIGLHELKDIAWLKTIDGKSFCDNLYEYVLHHTSKLPIIPVKQRL